MKTQHTLGQWKITGQETSRQDCTIRAVCDESGKQHELWVADVAKNCAPLIAAAPDLLEACKAVQEAFKSAPVLETDWKLPGAYKAWKLCVDSISKATGGE